MNTITHLIITGATRKKLLKDKNKKIPLSAAIIGSIAPDIALYLLTIIGFIWYRMQDMTNGEIFKLMFDKLYFENIFWISTHNLLHAPIILTLGLIISIGLKNKKPKMSKWLTVFFIAALAHSIIDIATHHDDGPLILFPFDLETRFNSPVSYWDHRYYGNEFFYFEMLLNLVLVIYWVNWKKIREKFRNDKK